MARLLSYDYLYLIPLTISSLLSLRSFWLRWPTSFKVFSGFLLSTSAIEWMAIFWKWELHKTDYWSYSLSNLWIYNAFTPIRHLFFSVFFYKLLHSPHLKKVIRWSAYCFIILAAINYFQIQTPHQVNTYSIIAANTIIIVFVLLFFRQALNESEVVRLGRSAEIWILLGAFAYYSGTLPFFMFFDYLVSVNSPVSLSYFYINDVLNLIMYTFYSIAFLCSPQFQK